MLKVVRIIIVLWLEIRYGWFCALTLIYRSYRRFGFGANAKWAVVKDNPFITALCRLLIASLVPLGFFFISPILEDFYFPN